MSVIIHRRRELAEKHVAALKEQRKETADLLNDLLTKLRKVDREAGPYDALELIETAKGNSVGVAEFQVISYLTRGVKIPHVFLNLSTCTLDDDGQAAADALQMARSRSKNYRRYVLDQDFAPVPVTEETENEIYKRAEIVAADEATARIYRNAEDMCAMANASTEHGGRRPTIGELTHGPNSIYKGLIKEVWPGADAHVLDTRKFVVDDSRLNMVRSDFRAFDEPAVQL